MSLLKIVSLFIFMISTTLNMHAQNKVTQVRPDFNNLKTQLKMDDKNFREFKHNLALFNDSITQIMNKVGLVSEDRRKSVEVIQTNRKTHLLKTLSKEQYATFADFEKNLQQSSLHRQRIEGKKG